MRLSPRERWIGFVATAVAALYVWFTLQPDLLLTNTTTNGGDTGAHVWWPAYLRDHILPKWQLTGWAPDWYAGFPAGVFYFPLPSLLIVVLDVVLPYNVAFKLVTALGPVMLPVAAYAFARGIGARWPSPPLFAAATLPFLFYTGYTIWGGNLASTLAGEFSFTIAICLALVFLGALARSLDDRRGLAVPAALLAATVMSHLIVAVFAAVGAIVIWLQRRPVRNLSPALAVAGVAFLVTAVWTVPLLLRLGYTTDMGWTKEEPWGAERHLLPDDLRWAFVLAAVGLIIGLALRRRATIGLVAMAVVFGVAFVVMPETRLWNARLMPFYYLSVLFLAASGVAELGVLLARAAPGIGWALWRAISTPEPEPEDLAADPHPVGSAAPPPGAEPVSVPPDAGSTAAAPVLGPPEPGPLPDPVLGPPEPRAIPADREPLPAGSRWQAWSWLVPALVVALGVGSAIGYTHRTRDFLPAWIRWNYSGYEAKPAYAEFREVITTMDQLPPGRALWEPSSAIDRYGTTLALELLPHFTEGRIGSMEGLYFESAATTPYHFMVVSALAKSPSNPVRGLDYRTLADFEFGVAQMRLMGVRYYMAQSDEAKAAADASPGLELVTETGSPYAAPSVARWKIYEVLDSPLVEPLRHEPLVLEGVSPKHWLEPSRLWFDDPSALDRPLVAGGLEEWVRVREWVRAEETEAPVPPKKPLPAVTVTNIASDDDSVSFDVSQPGVPVLVKTSYFPNWRAEGAEGPWRATPNLMVVVPTGTHVELHYGRTPVDWAGLLLSVAGLAGLAGLARWRLDPLPARPLRRGRAEGPGGPPAGPDGEAEAGSGDPSEDESAPVMA